ncbi:MAG TPA: NrfA- nitrite reduction protein [Opitutae bacterium]|nr:NrfA- nitrite reduction protein [Opitutae bacterium]
MFKAIKANLFWLILVGALAAYLSFALIGGAEHEFMPGQTTHGHHQIEMACSVCHTTGMGVKQDSCNECHQEELTRVDDSHPVIKFKDPRNASRLEQLDARYCITCHREHQPEITNSMGVTLPEDYCYYCHQEIGDERPSHKDFAFDSCATAGCHNFHDNSALYERFLASHLDEPDFKEVAKQRLRSYYDNPDHTKGDALEHADADMPDDAQHTHRILHDWSTTAHAAVGVNCTDCHNVKDTETGAITWQDRPGYTSCQECHKHETKGFLEGKHGMRLAQGLSPMTPSMAKIPMRAEAAHSELTCASCHDSHRFNTKTAAVDACLQCHNDDHSTAYKESPHFKLFIDAQRGLKSSDEAVSCATCHMPRVEKTEFGETITIVDHNQNNSLRPNDKMIRSSCIQCHGLQFTLNALADRDLIDRNFKGKPSVFVESLELAREEKERTEAAKK